MRAYRIAYDGSDYRGFQRQPDVPTVSDAILDALRALGVADAGAVPEGYAAAGRTDAGVSATAQTVALAAPDWLDPAALNSELPADVRAWASADVTADFHATHDATAREYTYYLHAGAVETDDGLQTDAMVTDDRSDSSTPEGGPAVPAPLVSRARDAIDRLAGEHDFNNLTPDDEGTVRTLETGLEVAGPFLVITVRADGFPRQLVRRLVSVVAEVARDDADLDRLDRLLGSAAVAGPEGVPPAPPEPLVLSAVEYPDVSFEADETAVVSARAVFQERRRELSTSARVAAHLADL